jgi:pimeloyl-ACP methyl ester carboxylesterase
VEVIANRFEEDRPMLGLLVLICLGIGLWLASHVVEALRKPPQVPKRLRWAPDLAIDYVTVDGYRLRYIRTGRGANLVLLHTLRTQLDLFEKIVSDLARDFTVYALDYPGHGYSDRGQYNADFFVRSVEGFLETLDLRAVTLCGVSIGGAISLILAGRRNVRVSRVLAINPYDYAKGRGMARSSPLGWGDCGDRSDSRGRRDGHAPQKFYDHQSSPAGWRRRLCEHPVRPTQEMYDVGNRRGHYRAFLSLLRNARSWETATAVYRDIRVPVKLIWGDKDWARANEREHDRSLIPGAEMVTVKDGGHFLPLDRPKELQELIIRFGPV